MLSITDTALLDFMQVQNILSLRTNILIPNFLVTWSRQSSNWAERLGVICLVKEVISISVQPFSFGPVSCFCWTCHRIYCFIWMLFLHRRRTWGSRRSLCFTAAETLQTQLRPEWWIIQTELGVAQHHWGSEQNCVWWLGSCCFMVWIRRPAWWSIWETEPTVRQVLAVEPMLLDNILVLLPLTANMAYQACKWWCGTHTPDTQNSTKQLEACCDLFLNLFHSGTITIQSSFHQQQLDSNLQHA